MARNLEGGFVNRGKTFTTESTEDTEVKLKVGSKTIFSVFSVLSVSSVVISNRRTFGATFQRVT